MSVYIPTECWAFLLRAAQAGIASAPYLLMGFLVAGYLRAMVGPDATRRLFGAGRWGGPLRAWMLGTIVPVCSLGVIPIVCELHRQRVPKGALLAFALGAPILNPFSLLYGMTVVEPRVLAAFVAASMAVTVLAAALCGSDPDAYGDSAPGEPQSPAGRGRLLVAVAEAARSLVGPAGGFVLVGLLGVGLLAAALPAGSLMTSMVYGNELAPLTIAPVAALAYVSPERAMMLVGEMFGHSSSPGAAFLLLVLGAGLNLGLVALLIKEVGASPVARWLLAVLGLALGLAYAINSACYIPGAEEGHTHIFDNFSSPYHSRYENEAARIASRKLAEDLSPASIASLAGLGVLALAGSALRTPWGGSAFRRLREGGSSAFEVPQGPRAVWGRPVPTRWLVVSGLLVLSGVSFAGAYVYYPSPDELFEDMKIVRADALVAVNTGPRDAASRHVASWESLAAKLAMGALLRGRLAPEMRKEAQELCEALGDLRAGLRRGTSSDDVRPLADAAQKTYDRCRAAFAKR